MRLLRGIYDFNSLSHLLRRPDFKFTFDGMHGVAGPYAKRIFVKAWQPCSSSSCLFPALMNLLPNFLQVYYIWPNISMQIGPLTEPNVHSKTELSEPPVLCPWQCTVCSEQLPRKVHCGSCSWSQRAQPVSPDQHLWRTWTT